MDRSLTETWVERPAGGWTPEHLPISLDIEPNISWLEWYTDECEDAPSVGWYTSDGGFWEEPGNQYCPASAVLCWRYVVRPEIVERMAAA